VRTIEPGAIIREAWRIYTEQASVLLPVSFALYGVSAVIAYGGAGLLGSLLTLIIGPFYQGMVVQLVRDVQDGRRDSSPLELLQSVAPVVGALLAVSILAAIGIGIGLVLILAPGLFLLTIWAVVAPVTVLERPGIFAAFSRSQDLVRGNGWRVFATILIVFLLGFVLNVVVVLAAAGLGKAGVYGLSWIIEALTAPLTALTSAVLYFALLGGGPDSAPITPTGPVGVEDALPGLPADPERPPSVPPPGF
jgi:hypothetical protein